MTEIREWADVIWSFPALLLQEEKGEVRVVAKSTSGNVCVRERAERAIEIDARAPYRKFPNEQRVVYGANPARVNTPRYRRYENYSDASTIGGARRLGATSQDISQDIQAGALRLL